MSVDHNIIPAEGFVPLTRFMGDRKQGIAGICPMARSTFYASVNEGRLPKPVPLPGLRGRFGYRAETVRAIIAGTWKPEGEQA